MLISKQKVALPLVFILIATFLAPVWAVEYNPGVSVGQYVVFGHWHGINTPFSEVMNWKKVEVVAVSGKEVTLLTTGQYKNGTAMPYNGDTYIYNLETGATNETHSDLKSIIPANLNEGDTVPPGTFAVGGTEIRTYLGVGRVVNIVVEEAKDANVTVAYDKASGMALEWQSWMTQPNGVEAAIQYDISDTNIFEVPRPAASIPMAAFYALGAVAVVLPIMTVIVLRRRTPHAETEALEKKVIDLTYNLSGVNRGECYLAESLQSCLKIVSDLHSRGVNGLCIVREDPEFVTKNYGLKPEDVVLLSSQPIKGFKAISSLQEISIAVTKFLKSGGGAVLLDGLEYLVSRFGFNTVYMCLQEKHIEFLEAGAVLLIPVNMETLDSREKSQLLSELKLL